MADPIVIAVDGPSGSGKGTLAQSLAQRLAWHYLDSGALYRIVALAALERGVDLDNGGALATLARTLSIRFSPDRLPPTVELDGRDVTHAIRAEPVSVAASRVAAHPELRAALIATQRAFRRPPGLVADGRDMGTVVFPDAGLKIFLEASAEERAERRYKQLKDKDLSVSLRALLESIRERDARDRQRAASPLIPAPDAVVIDSTGLTIEGVQERAWQCVVAAGLAPG
jgi:cytidylate kinase